MSERGRGKGRVAYPQTRTLEKTAGAVRTASGFFRGGGGETENPSPKEKTAMFKPATTMGVWKEFVGRGGLTAV